MIQPPLPLPVFLPEPASEIIKIPYFCFLFFVFCFCFIFVALVNAKAGSHANKSRAPVCVYLVRESENITFSAQGLWIASHYDGS